MHAVSQCPLFLIPSLLPSCSSQFINQASPMGPSPQVQSFSTGGQLLEQAACVMPGAGMQWPHWASQWLHLIGPHLGSHVFSHEEAVTHWPVCHSPHLCRLRMKVHEVPSLLLPPSFPLPNPMYPVWRASNLSSLCCARCRHAVAAVGSYVFSYGGLRGSTLR